MNLKDRYESYIDTYATGALSEQLKQDNVILSEFKSFAHKLDNRAELLKRVVDNRTCRACKHYDTCETFERECKRFESVV